MLQAELKVASGKQEGNTIPLSPGKFLVGREEDCHLRPNSELISRHHCVFTLDEYALRVRDLGSTNGTFVNGERIRGGVVLNPGDVVSFGKLEFSVIIRDPAAEETAQLKVDSDTHHGLAGSTEGADTVKEGLEEVIAAADEDASATDTVSDLPPVQPPSGDTQFTPPQGVPQQQPLGYPMYPQQMMPYGYPGYPPMYPMQMGYPGMPGMYPQQPMPDQATQDPAAQPAENEPALRLPDPSETGVKPPAPVDPNAPPEERTAAQKSKEDAPLQAAGIIQQYLKRRPGGGS
jgi:hypothetical protein